MLCKDCDYYHSFPKEKFLESHISFCEFADTLFLDDVENLEVEYPCKNIDFNEHMQKKSAGISDAAVSKKYVRPELVKELKECGVCMLKFPEGITEKCFHEQLANSATGKASLEMAEIRKR